MSTTATTATTTDLSLLQLKASYDKLSTTRKAIIALTADGRTEIQIALELGLKVKTIKFHKTDIFKLLKIKSSAAELVSVHYKLNLQSDNNIGLLQTELFKIATERDFWKTQYESKVKDIEYISRSYGVLPMGVSIVSNAT